MEAQFNREEAIKRFGECKYSCQLTSCDSWFHTVTIPTHNIYIEEWPDDDEDLDKYIGSVFDKEHKHQGFVANILSGLLDDIQEYLKE